MLVDVKKVQICVTAPPENIEEIRKAMCDAGAGNLGNYSYCSISVKNVGTFMPNKNANPYIGKTEKIEYVEEESLEIFCEVDKVKQVVKAIRKVHPYEEPAIIIIPIIDEREFN